MMEQSDAGEAHYHIVLIGCFDHVIIPDGTAGLCYIFYSALMSSFNIISEREESIRSESHILHAVKPCSLSFACEHFGTYLECLLPYIISDHVHIFLAYIQIDRIVPVSSAYTVYELKSQHLGRLAQIPVIGLAARKPGAVDPRLLSGADAYGLTVLYVADGIGLWMAISIRA